MEAVYANDGNSHNRPVLEPPYNHANASREEMEDISTDQYVCIMYARVEILLHSAIYTHA